MSDTLGRSICDEIAYLVQRTVDRRVRDLDDTCLAREVLRSVHVAQTECAGAGGVDNGSEVLPIVRLLSVGGTLKPCN